MAYTDEELRKSLTQLADELGGTPTRKQCNKAETTPSSETYFRRFGSWDAALEESGLDVNPDSFTDDELIVALREFADRLGETPTQGQVTEEPELPSARLYYSRFGNWNVALQAAGLEVNQESYTDEELLTILQEFAAELGHTPTRPDLETRDDLPSATTYKTRFGSWNDALRAAGLAVNQEIERYDGTDEELLVLLREFASECDTSISMYDVNFAPDLPHSSVFAQQFGSWNEAKQAAGLDIRAHQNHYTDVELLQELQRVAHELGKTPTQVEMNNADAPSPTTCARRFGSWTAALEAAGLMETQEPPTQ